MSIISTEKLGHIFNDRWLFKDLTFGLQKGDRVALVGINGTGKSTLLKIIAGNIVPTEGKVVSEKEIKIGYLEQEPDFSNLFTVEDFIFSLDRDTYSLLSEYETLSNQSDAPPARLTELIDLINQKDAWNLKNKAEMVFDRLGISDVKQSIHNLSGGQKKRLSLAKLLIDEPDIYLLDEPTNHLDIETIEWLEKMLTSGQKTVLFITHDRYFLDNICTEIKELDQGILYSYKGKYGYFLEKKSERALTEKAELDKNRNLLRKELEWMRRQPQARGTKSKARIDAFYDLENKTKTTGQTSSVELNVKISRLGNKIIELDQVSKSYGSKKVISSFSYVFKKGDRIGLAGRNGSGKSTFLNIITQQIPPDSGTLSIGETIVFGYYKQQGLTFDPQQRVIDVVKEVAEYITMSNGEMLSASQLLNQFLFTPEKQFNPVEKLSGGEKKRLQLLRILIKNPNVLILDEPTNDLDIDTLNVLENFLETYAGVLILVSHDRFLLDKLSDQLFIFETGKPTYIFNGNYSDYKLEEKNTKITIEKPVKEQQNIKQEKNKLSYKEQREFQELDQQIQHIEEKIKNKTDLISKTSDHIQLTKLSEEIALHQQELDKKSMRWLELSELI